MALSKVTYTDLVTIIGAQNLNDIQDTIIALEEWQIEAGADIPQILANIAPSFSNSTSYSAGDCVIVLNKLYQFTAAHPAGNWTGADAEEVNVTSLLKEAVASLSGDVDDLKSALESCQYGLSESAKQALLQLAQKVAYIDEHGQDYYQDLYDALYPAAALLSITATYTQSGTVYDTDTLDSLKADLVVTAVYSDSSTATVAAEDYTLSGTLTEGTSTITVSYGGKSTTFSVSVMHNDTIVYTFETVDGEYIPAVSGAIDQNAEYSRTALVSTQGASEIEVPAVPENSDVVIGFWTTNDVTKNPMYRRKQTVGSDRYTIDVIYAARYFAFSAKTTSLGSYLSGDFFGTKNRAVTGWTNGVAYSQFELVQNQYIKNDGTSAPGDYTGWSRTKFIDCHGATSISFAPLTTDTTNNKYNAFYDEYFKQLSTFTLSGSQKSVPVPEGAYYFAVSGSDSNMARFIAGDTVPTGGE